MSTENGFRNKLYTSVAMMCLLPASNAFAQEAGDASEDDAAALLEEDVVEEVVVTGSRLRRSEFNSAAPLQVISGAVSREAGLFDTSQILQSTSQSSGLQIDTTFTSFVLDNGIGSATIGFRGLDPSRTLVLLNGRRIAPAGAGGAPVAADLNLIPAALIDRVENIFDGASAVYGSDAVAGVANVIFRSDVDGLEVQASGALPESGGGEEFQVTTLYGETGDNWNFTAALEYNKRKRFTYRDSDFFNACDEYRFEDENGALLTQYRGLAPGTTDSACRLNTYNRVAILDGIFGNVWYTGGETNIGIPNFSETTIGPGLAPFAPPGTITQIDDNGDGVLDDTFLLDIDQNGLSEIDLQTPFYNYDLSDRALDSDIDPGLERVSFFANGSYNFEDDNNTEAYFEGYYVRRESNVRSPSFGFFPRIPANNPFNITNSNGLGVNSLNFFGVDFGAFDVVPIIYVRGDRDEQDVSVEQYRLLGGVSGNIGALDDFLGGSWSYDAYVSYSDSKGITTRQGINEDRLDLSLATTIEDPNNPGTFICGADGDGDGIPDGTDGCVPFNAMADSLFQAGGGTFGSQAEADYFFAVSEFDTRVDQLIINGAIQGDLFDLWNEEAVPLLLGYEYRRDSIASIPNDITANGSLFASNQDLGATGSRFLHEFFAETSLTLVKGEKFADLLQLDLSGRYTDESNFGGHFTYSIKGLYRPVDFLTIRGSYGTSYRAPNLRESFLAGQTGFTTIGDPCVVPTDARDTGGLSVPNAPETYNANNDTRTNLVLDNCRATGVDPTTLGLETGAGDGFIGTAVSAEIVSGGTEALQPETSTSYTIGAVLEQPFTDAFDLKFSVTYYNIDIRDGIAEPSGAFIINDCYLNPQRTNGSSGFCSRVGRDADGQIELLDGRFINIGTERTSGYDFNVLYEQDFTIGSENLSVSLDVTATRVSEDFEEVFGSGLDLVGRPSVPRWRGSANLILGYQDFRFNWFTRFIQGGENIPDEFDDDAVPCDGLPVGCRPIYFTNNYDLHNASVSYSFDQFTVNMGVRNVFNTRPPQVDSAGVFSVRNVPLGVGYNLTGRTFFSSVTARF